MKQRHLVLAMLCVLAVLLYLDRICISVALPRIQDELAIPPERVGWLAVAFSLAYALCEVPSGYLGDRHGPRRTLTRIVLWWSAFTALSGAAFSFPGLLVTRFLFGAGEAGGWPNASAVVGRWFPADRRARAMGIFGAATQIGGACSPLLVIPIQHAYGWRASFFVFGACGLGWAALWYRWFRDRPADKPGITAAELAELADPGAGGGADAAPDAHGSAWKLALADRNVWGLMVMGFCGVYTAYFGAFWMPTFLAKGRGFSESELRWIAVAWIGGIVGNAAGGVFGDALVVRLGRRRGRSVAGSSALAAGAVCYALAALAEGKVATLAALTGSFIVWGPLQATAFAACIDIGRRHAGTVAGFMNTAAQLGGAVSALAFGYIVDTADSYDAPLYVMTGVGLAGAATWWWIDAERPLAGA